MSLAAMLSVRQLDELHVVDYKNNKNELNERFLGVITDTVWILNPNVF
jgi:hypothetical protein